MSVLLDFYPYDIGVLTPTTAGQLIDIGTNRGALTGFDFISSNEFNLIAGNEDDLSGSPSYQISFLTVSEILPGESILSITNTPSSTTPEPASVGLIGAAATALGFAFRRRRA